MMSIMPNRVFEGGKLGAKQACESQLRVRL
jgi:hypothetical protein